jgi:RNA-directed DNA polymerase
MEERDHFSDGEPSLLNRIASIESLYKAWRKVRANRGAAGVDAVSIRVFERGLDANLAELRRNLLNASYEPLPARYVTVVRSNGKQRELAILCVRDRVAQRSVLDVVEPLIEPEMLDCSYAFRPGRSVEMAVQRVIVARAQGRRWTVDADVQEFFPAISHGMLLEEMSIRVADPRVMALIKQWLEAGALDGARPAPGWIGKWRASLSGARLAVRDSVNNLIDGFVSDRLGEADNEDGLIGECEQPEVKKRHGKIVLHRIVQDGILLALVERAALRGALSAKVLGLGGAALGLAVLAPPAIRKVREMLSDRAGTLIGSPLSPVLSNLYMHPFDVTLTGQGRTLVRYCDDFVILCGTRDEAIEAMRSAEAALKERKLRLNAEKSRLVPPGEPFDFLGYHFMADGRVVAPRSTPEVVARRVGEFAERHIRSATTRVQKSARRLMNK